MKNQIVPLPIRDAEGEKQKPNARSHSQMSILHEASRQHAAAFETRSSKATDECFRNLLIRTQRAFAGARAWCRASILRLVQS